MTRILLPLFALAILLTSCGGGGGGKLDCSENYWDGYIGVCLPDKWLVMDSETLRLRGVPEETVAAFRYEESISGQFPSITVTRENLKREVGPSDYSEASIRSVSSLPGYTLIDSKPVKIDGKEVSIHVFTAQPIAEEPARKFYQLSSVSGELGFTVTAAAPLFVEKDMDNELRDILKNVTFKGKDSEEAKDAKDADDDS